MEKESALNQQVGGDHYKKLGEYQPWLVLSRWMSPEELKGAMKKEVIAYLQREASKGGIEDIRKAHHTLGIYLELVDSESTYEGSGNPKTYHVYDAYEGKQYCNNQCITVCVRHSVCNDPDKKELQF